MLSKAISRILSCPSLLEICICFCLDLHSTAIFESKDLILLYGNAQDHQIFPTSEVLVPLPHSAQKEANFKV